jgi:uncharacterized protein (TIGR00255 family)
MINSMTAYAAVQKKTDDWEVSVEMRSVNNRFLDVAIRLPSRYTELEEQVKKVISRRFLRGRIEVRFDIARTESGVPTFEVDEALADGYVRLLQSLKERYAIVEPLSLKHLLELPGVIRSVENRSESGQAWPVVEKCLEEAASALEEMRKREGDFIAADLEARISAIGVRFEEIEAAAKELPGIYRQRLLERIEALTDGTVLADPTRVAQEVAFMAERSDISEEIVRAASHLKQFTIFMAEPEPAGKKINFLLQELNREVNTIGSKADRTGISHRVVEIKTELEKIREQIQNIE